MQLSAICRRAWDCAERKGWHTPADTPPAKLLMIHAEVTEAAEELRDGRDPRESYLDASGKPCGFGSELADVVIRVADLAVVLGIDLEREIGLKMAFNETRPHRHGGKAF
jgi:NTP pyrophosphatase (non-canonical NTP hydrolase)